MPFSSWLLFVGSTFLICAAPGPNMLHMMVIGATHGVRKSVYSMAGCFLAVLILIAASVAGVGIILASSPAAFNVLRIAGAAYLIYLGVQAWRAPVTMDGVEITQDRADVSGKQLLRKAFFIGMSNPKALLFAAAFFPQFIDPHQPQLPQMVILLATFTVLEISWYTAYALGGSRMAYYMERAPVRRMFNRVVGSLFAGFGTALILQSV